MKPLFCSVVVLFCYLICFTSLAVSRVYSTRMPAPVDEPLLAAPALKMLSPGKFDIDGCVVDKGQESLTFPAMINMDKEGQILEYLLVENSGKLHESLLKTEISPYAIQISLLLLGLEGSLDPLIEQGENRIPTGTPVTIRVNWHENGQSKSTYLHDWVLKGSEVLANIPWVFTGSYIHENGLFVAQVDKSIIAIYHDPAAIIDHQTPDGNSDTIWFVNTNKIPPAGTQVELVIEKKQI